MLHYIKFRLLAAKYLKLKEKIDKGCGDDMQLRMLNYHLCDLETLCYDMYNEALFCPFFSKEKKRLLLAKCEGIKDALNMYRLENGFA